MFPPFLTYRLSVIQLVHFERLAASHKSPDITEESRHYRLPTYFHGATIWCAEAASALTAAAICQLIAPLTLPSQSEAISPQAECADPGIRLTVLYRKAETGKRLMGSAQAISILADVPIIHLR
jgi:hypothetical protein